MKKVCAVSCRLGWLLVFLGQGALAQPELIMDYSGNVIQSAVTSSHSPPPLACASMQHVPLVIQRGRYYAGCNPISATCPYYESARLNIKVSMLPIQEAGGPISYVPCTVCAYGWHLSSSTDWSTTCLPCLLGSYAYGRMTACEVCAAGSTSSLQLTSCEVCAPGTFAPTAGSWSCQNCASGTYSNTSNSTACTACPERTFTTTPATTCLSCGTTYTWSLRMFMGSCVCPMGFWRTVDPAHPSTLMFSDARSYCQPCLQPSACQNGTYLTFQCTGAESSMNACLACETGLCASPMTYRHQCTRTQNSVCTRNYTVCPAGMYMRDHTLYSDGVCTPCEVCLSNTSVLQRCTQFTPSICSESCNASSVCPKSMSVCVTDPVVPTISKCVLCPPGYRKVNQVCVECNRGATCNLNDGSVACHRECPLTFTPDCQTCSFAHTSVSALIYNASVQFPYRNSVLGSTAITYRCLPGFYMHFFDMKCRACTPPWSSSANRSTAAVGWLVEVNVSVTRGLADNDAQSCVWERINVGAGNMRGYYSVRNLLCPPGTTSQADAAVTISDCVACPYVESEDVKVTSPWRCEWTCRTGYVQTGAQCIPERDPVACTGVGLLFQNARCTGTPVPWHMAGLDSSAAVESAEILEGGDVRVASMFPRTYFWPLRYFVDANVTWTVAEKTHYTAGAGARHTLLRNGQVFAQTPGVVCSMALDPVRTDIVYVVFCNTSAIFFYRQQARQNNITYNATLHRLIGNDTFGYAEGMRDEALFETELYIATSGDPGRVIVLDTWNCVLREVVIGPAGPGDFRTKSYWLHGTVMRGVPLCVQLSMPRFLVHLVGIRSSSDPQQQPASSSPVFLFVNGDQRIYQLHARVRSVVATDMRVDFSRGWQFLYAPDHRLHLVYVVYGPVPPNVTNSTTSTTRAFTSTTTVVVPTTTALSNVSNVTSSTTTARPTTTTPFMIVSTTPPPSTPPPPPHAMTRYSRQYKSCPDDYTSRMGGACDIYRPWNSGAFGGYVLPQTQTWDASGTEFGRFAEVCQAATCPLGQYAGTCSRVQQSQCLQCRVNSTVIRAIYNVSRTSSALISQGYRFVAAGSCDFVLTYPCPENMYSNPIGDCQQCPQLTYTTGDAKTSINRCICPEELVKDPPTDSCMVHSGEVLFPLFDQSPCSSFTQYFDENALTCRPCAENEASRPIFNIARPPLPVLLPAGLYNCPRGYGKANFSSPCVPCPAGSSNSAGDSRQCSFCAPGFSLGCSMCFLNTYTDSAGATECLPCPTGTYAVRLGATRCTNETWLCPAGAFRMPLLSEDCELCPLSTFSVGGTITDCTPCPTGTYTPTTGSSVCYIDNRSIIANNTFAGNSSVNSTFFGNTTTSSAGIRILFWNTTQFWDPMAQTTDVLHVTLEDGRSVMWNSQLWWNNVLSNDQWNRQQYGTSLQLRVCPPRYGRNKLGICQLCSPGTFWFSGFQVGSLVAESKCKICSDEFTTNCNKCVAGEYQDMSGQYKCKMCPRGQQLFAPYLGMTACIGIPPTCPDGYYYQTTFMPLCQPCSAGSYSLAGEATSCTSCPLGTYNRMGMSTCLQCPAGTYTRDASAGDCAYCPAGKYSAANSSQFCYRCPSGYFSFEGSTACLECKYFSPRPLQCQTTAQCRNPNWFTAPTWLEQTGDSLRCQQGQYLANISGAGTEPVCLDCPPHLVGRNGWWCEACTGYRMPYFDRSVCVCRLPAVQDGNDQCTCPPGYGFSATAGCFMCPNHTYTSEGLVLRDDWWTQNAPCLPCPEGQYSAAGSAGCLPCPKYTIRAPEWDSCKPCKKGWYGTGSSQAYCKECSTACAVAQYSEPCPTDASMFICMNCDISLRPWDAYWVLPTAALSTEYKCTWMCYSGFYRAQSQCLPCTVLSCPPGKALQACTAIQNGNCDADCVNSTKPLFNSVWQSGCNWGCASGYVAKAINYGTWTDYECVLPDSVPFWTW